METKVNKPYVKAYDDNGELINPIHKSYTSFRPNRKSRRLKNVMHVGNTKKGNLVVINNGLYSSKYKKELQRVPLWESEDSVRVEQNIIGYKTIIKYKQK